MTQRYLLACSLFTCWIALASLAPQRAASVPPQLAARSATATWTTTSTLTPTKTSSPLPTATRMPTGPTATPSAPTATLTAVAVGQRRIGSISFVDLRRGWMTVGDDILRTRDGGATWRAVGHLRGVQRIDFVSSTVGWAHTPHALYRSDDGGRTWREIGSGLTNIAWIDFVDTRYGWVRAEGGIYFTRDGGRSFRQVQPTWDHRGPFAVRRPGVVWYVGLSLGDGLHPNTVYRTFDEGQHWARAGVYHPDRPYDNLVLGGAAYDLFVLNDKRGWMVTTDTKFGDGIRLSRIHTTGDGGLTWTSLSTVAPGSLHSLAFVTARHGYVIAQQERRSLLFRTSDGGTSWQVAYEVPLALLTATPTPYTSH